MTEFENKSLITLLYMKEEEIKKLYSATGDEGYKEMLERLNGLGSNLNSVNKIYKRYYKNKREWKNETQKA